MIEMCKIEDRVTRALLAGGRVEPGRHHAELVSERSKRDRTCGLSVKLIIIVIVFILLPGVGSARDINGDGRIDCSELFESLFSSSASAQPAPRVTQEKLVSYTSDGAIFARTKAEVWEALIDSLSRQNVHPESMDATSCIVLFKSEGTWSQQWGGTNQSVALLTTKKVGRMSSWQGFMLSGNIRCKQLESERTQVTITMEYAGVNGFANWAGGAEAGWQRLYSSGYFERLLIKGIESHLADVVTRPGDVSFVRIGSESLDLLRKVDAAFKIDAGQAPISEALIASQAKLDSLSEQFKNACPLLSGHMTHAQKFFLDSRDPSARAENLIKARDSLKLAAKHLDSFATTNHEAVDDEPPKPLVLPSHN